GGGGGHYGGGSYHGGGGFYGGGMRVAPSHSYAPSISGASRMPAVSGRTLPSAGGANGAASGAAHSAFRVPTNGSNAISNAARATSWNNASHAQLQHVNTNLTNAVKSNGALSHSLTSTSVRAGAANGALNGAKSGALSPQASAIRGNWNANGNNHCMNGR